MLRRTGLTGARGRAHTRVVLGVRTGLRLPREGLMIAPLPGATVEVVGRLVGRVSQTVVVTACLHAESWLAVCRDTGRIWAVVHPSDMLDVQRDGSSFRVPAGMTALPSAPLELVMVCPPPLDAASAL